MKKMAIVAGYSKEERYGLLGPQMAATIIEDHTPYQCKVIAVTRHDTKDSIHKALSCYFGNERPIIGWSYLAGRQDLFELAKEATSSGAVTILAGPQAQADFVGEPGLEEHTHRFEGLSKNFTCALQGPAEQIFPLLADPEGPAWKEAPGFVHVKDDGRIAVNKKTAWNAEYLGRVRWDNICVLRNSEPNPLEVSSAQVLKRIGCPYAARDKQIEVDYPTSMETRAGQRIRVRSRGCDFCDVASEKGDHGALDQESVILQIECLPDAPDGRKIPFELIDEYPLPGLAPLLGEVKKRKLKLSRIDLILRADWLVKGEEPLRAALKLAKDMGVFVLLASVGFESFEDRILRNLNKGLDVETNLEAIRLMRRLKEDFPDEWGYSSADGALHGLIHPTPWDTEESFKNMRETMSIFGLPSDILPAHSVPLVIHHASALADWIREIENKEGVRYKRHGSVIGWWERL